LAASDNHLGLLHLALRINIKDGIEAYATREKNVLNMDEIIFKFSEDNHKKEYIEC
jgi:hypothetical protein